jgi:hypothetical protein
MQAAATATINHSNVLSENWQRMVLITEGIAEGIVCPLCFVGSPLSLPFKVDAGKERPRHQHQDQQRAEGELWAGHQRSPK